MPLRTFLRTMVFTMVIGSIFGSYSNSYFLKNIRDPIVSNTVLYLYLTSNEVFEEPIDKPEESIQNLRDFMTQDARLSGLDGHYPLVHTSQHESCADGKDTPSIAQILCATSNEKPNILLILMESFRAQEIGALGSSLGLTPFFDQWSRRVFYLRTFLPTVIKHDMALWQATAPSFPITDIPFFLITKKNSFQCLPHIFNKMGYSTLWAYGSDASFDNKIEIIPHFGFEKMFDQYEFPKTAQKFGWGYLDQDLFKLWLDKLNDLPQPFFSSALTIIKSPSFRRS